MPRAPQVRPALRRTAILACLGLGAGPAVARLNQTELSRVAAAPAPDARVPLDLAFTDTANARTVTLGEAIAGRAVLMLPVDYTCGNVCDPMLAMASAALVATGLVAGRDYGLVLVGIDARDDARDARRMLDADLALPMLAAKASALVGDAAAIEQLTRALGYRFVFDAATDSFAHPAAAFLLTSQGRVARVLSPLALNGRDLRLALVEAEEGRTGSLGDRLALLCYGYDAVRGIYTPLIQRILSIAAMLTVLAIALGIFLLSRRPGRA
ncbi:electron transporter [uncultured Methylobacterium sp.]|uniref:electron transporter n=1 Tax=uncultured Methylobacterium sp. TaxID=157278 RepID=UPI0035C985D1